MPYGTRLQGGLRAVGVKCDDAVFFLGALLVNPEKFVLKFPGASRGGDRVNDCLQNIVILVSGNCKPFCFKNTSSYQCFGV